MYTHIYITNDASSCTCALIFPISVLVKPPNETGIERQFAWTQRCECSCVYFTSDASCTFAWIFPISVLMPVATTTPTAPPPESVVPENIMLVLSWMRDSTPAWIKRKRIQLICNDSKYGVTQWIRLTRYISISLYYIYIYIIYIDMYIDICI